MTSNKHFQIHKSIQSPPYNYNSTLVNCVGTNIVFLFGGFDDFDRLDSNIYLLDTKSMTWKVDKKHALLYREGHLANYIGNGNVLVFGGIATDDEGSHHTRSRNHFVNEEDRLKRDSLMLIYNIYSMSWTRPPDFVLNNAPSPRSRHASCLSPDGKKIYISGGVVDSNTFDDLYSYDFTTGSWEGPFSFVHRFDHFITIYGNKIYSFGGLNKNMNHVKDRISYFDIDDKVVGEISIFSTKTPLNNVERRFLEITGNGPIRLDITLPNPNFDTKETGGHLAYYNLSKLSYVNLIELDDLKAYFKSNFDIEISSYFWKDAVFCDSGSILLLGGKHKDEYNFGPEVSQIDDQNDNEQAWNTNDSNIITDSEQQGHDDPSSDDGKLTYILEIESKQLGIEFNEKIRSLSSISESFKLLLASQEFTDFDIYCYKDISDKEEFVDLDPMDLDKEYLTTIKVHKIVLVARWPYFKRLIESGMNESESNRLFIAEPAIWVKGLIYYLYSDSIDFEPPIVPLFSLIDYSGLLILTNVYELVGLRALVLSKLYENLDHTVTKEIAFDSEQLVEAFLKIWCNIYISNEPLLNERLTRFLRQNWSTLVLSQAFSQLPKQMIVKLTQLCTVHEDGQITPRRSTRVNLLLGNNDLSSSVGSPDRDCNSPFLQLSLGVEKPKRTENLLANFPILQHLSTTLNDAIND